MEFKNDKCTFTVPDRPTVRLQMQWYGAAGGIDGATTWVRYWEGAKQLIQNWKCESMPDLNAIDLDVLTNPSDREILIWAGLQVLQHMNSLEDIPKN